MKRTFTRFFSRGNRCLLPCLLFSTLSLLLFISLAALTRHKSPPTTESPFLRSDPDDGDSFSGTGSGASLPELPRFAYFISGTRGDALRVHRLLRAVYHPRNYYLLHLDFDAPESERIELAKGVKADRVVREVRNVAVVGKANLVTYKGPTTISCTLHAIALLLKMGKDWDWFINLSASDYPVMRPDDILHIFSYLPRDLNFLEHTTNIGWKEFQRARPIVIDPGLYHSTKSGVFWAKEKRSMPSSFKLFLGSEGVVLTRTFLEFCIWGWDNLPRTLLMYYTNFLSSSEGYFHTVVCNHKGYQNTTVNHDLHYIKWDNPPKELPLNLTAEHFNEMVKSGAPFARTFASDNQVLDKIDSELLGRSANHFTPGGWCLGDSGGDQDPCAIYGSEDAVRPTVSSKRLAKLMANLLSPQNFRPKQCK